MKLSGLIFNLSAIIFFSACGGGSGSGNNSNGTSDTPSAGTSSSASAKGKCEDSVIENGKTYSVKSNILKGDIEHNCKLSNFDGAYRLTQANSFIVTDLKITSMLSVEYTDGEHVGATMYDDSTNGLVSYVASSTKYGSAICEETYYTLLPVEAFNDIYSENHIDDILFGYTQEMTQTSNCPSWVKAEGKTSEMIKYFTVTEEIKVTDSDGNQYEIKTLTELR